MFKFLKDSVSEDEDEVEKSTSDSVEAGIKVPCTESSVTDLQFQISKSIQFSQVEVGQKGWELKYLMVNHLLQSEFLLGQSNHQVRTILGSASDLNSGVYEGGFKIWECTFDLISYLDSHSGSLPLQGTQVLDLGCGAGLLGMYALHYGANRVDFQDFNSEVIDFITIPNCLLNFPDEDVAKCKFWNGSWESMLNNPHISSVKFDYILTSETLYNLNYFPILHNIFENNLKPRGSIFIAAKTCYFGVGGGTKLFLNLVQDNGIFNHTVVETIRTGIQREIIQLTFR